MILSDDLVEIFQPLCFSKLHQKYSESIENAPTIKEHELADYLFLLFDQLMDSAELLVDNIVTLDFDDYNDDDDDDDENYHEEDDFESLVQVDGIKYSYNTMCAIVKYSKTHTFQSLHYRYKNIKHKEQLRRIKQYVNAEGTKLQKFQQIDKFAYSEFARMRESCLPIHDFDVRRLAIKRARSLNLTGFMASHHWLSDFKHRHHISSRKITKLVTKNFIEDRDKIQKSVEIFVSKVKNRIVNYAADHILNSDQSSFN